MMDDVEIAASDLLAYRELDALPTRGDDEPVASGVRCGRPLVYPVPVADLPEPVRRRAEAGGGAYAGVLFAFDLDELPRGQRYVAARFRVTLDDPRARAVHLAADGDEFGVVQNPSGPEPASATAARTVTAAGGRPGWLRRLAGRAGVPRAWTSGAQSPDFGWHYDDPDGETLLPRGYGMHALVELPPDAATLTGRLGVQVETAAAGLLARRGVARLTEDVAFAEPLVAADPPRGAAVRLCMAADVMGYSRHTDPETARLQRELVGVLSRARRAAGIADHAVAPQAQGDGQFTVLPVGIDESAVIPRLVTSLAAALHEVNRDRPADDPMRLRLALHRGLTSADVNGWVGTATIAVHRILDSRPLREALAGNPAAGFVLGVPDVLFQDVIRHAVEPPLPASFTEMVVEMPEKDFVEHAWLHVGA